MIQGVGVRRAVRLNSKSVQKKRTSVDFRFFVHRGRVYIPIIMRYYYLIIICIRIMGHSFSAELLKGSAKNIILAVLCEREMYGYEIIKAIRDKSNDVVRLGEGNVYPALHDLEQAGLLVSRWVELPTKIKRKYYHLTPEGRKHLKNAQEDWGVFSRAMSKIYQGV